MRNQAINWGDGFTGLKQERAKRAMLGVHPKVMDHVKNWKPQLLIVDTLTENDEPSHPELLKLAGQLKKGNGLAIFNGIKVASESRENFISCKMSRNKLHDFFDSKRIEVISKVVLAKKMIRGIKNVLQNAGLGILEPNTLLLPWSDDISHLEDVEKIINYAQKVGLATLCAWPINLFDISNEKLRGSIDIWWLYYDGGLMCLIAFLLKKHKTWRKCQVRIFLVIPAEQGESALKTLENLKNWLENNRVFTSVYTEIVEIPAVLLSGFTEKGKELLSFNSNYNPFFYKLENSYSLPSSPLELCSKIMEFSIASDLVITVMPKRLPTQTIEHFLNYMNSLIKELKRVIIVVPTKNSVITDYN